MDDSSFDSGSGKYHDSELSPGSESCPISKESALQKESLSNFVFTSHTSSYLKRISHSVLLSGLLNGDKLCTPLPEPYLRLLKAPAPSKMPHWLLSRLRAECSDFANKTFEGLKGPERSTKLFMVLTGPWEARKMGGLKRRRGALNIFLGCLITARGP